MIFRRNGMKKIIALALSAVTAFTLTACASPVSMIQELADGQSAQNMQEVTAGSAAEESGDKLKIAVLMGNTMSDFRNIFADAAAAKGDQMEMSVTVFDGAGKLEMQAEQIRQCITDEYDGIIIDPVGKTAVSDVMKEAADAGIPIINTGVHATVDDGVVSAYCAADDAAAGEMEMTKVIEAIGGSGNVAILNGPLGNDIQTLRRVGYQNVLAENPDVKVAFEADAGWDTAKAKKTVKGWLSSGTKLSAIVCESDSMAVGAAQACAEAGRTDIPVYGIDADLTGLTAVRDGQIVGTVSQDPAALGEYAIRYMYDLCKGNSTDKDPVTASCIWIDESNIGEYLK